MEQGKERRKLGLAILISLFLHFLVGFSLAAFGSAFTPALPLEDKPVELTIVDLSATPPPIVPKDPPFMETAPSQGVGGEAKGADLRVERQLDRGEQASRRRVICRCRSRTAKNARA